jgi:hypothetical protein
MREKLIAHAQHGDRALDELPREAVRRLALQAAAPRAAPAPPATAGS